MPVNDKNAQRKLAEYTAKRQPEATPEPFPTGARRPGQFVVHLHAARRRHFDLRLERDGVLRCWAVPHGPSLDPAVKRLAVQTEDHPVEYLDFEDVIPAGNYGAGAMIVWDRGRWVERQDEQTGEDKLLFDLYGYKLRGRWTLVRTRRDPKEWLLIKKADAHARAAAEGDELPAESVYSGLTVEQLGEGVQPGRRLRRQLERAGARPGRVPLAELEPMLARAEPQAFSRRGWLFEFKYDGYRLLAGLDGGDVLLRYRSGGVATEAFPELLPALRHLRCESAVLDGEVVVVGEDGRPDFRRIDAGLRPLPLRERKRALARLVPRLGPVRYSEHVEREGRALFDQVRRLGLEGVVAKRADAPYRSGRSGRWLKIRADRTVRCAIVGYAPARDGNGIGALLVAVRDGERWRCLGRVGSGLDERRRAELLRRLEAEVVPGNTPPPQLELPPALGKRRGAAPPRWVRPRLACAVRFKELTRDGLLRQPVFEGLLGGEALATCTAEQRSVREAARQQEPTEDAPGVATGGAPGAPASARRTAITRPDKLLWPDDGFTKGDLIAYYRAVAPWLLPYLADRPVVLDRYPDGVTGGSFFQKHAPHFAPAWLRTVRVPAESGGRDTDYFVLEHEEALVYVANAAAIPLHVWSSRVGSLERPDWLVLDLDPKEAPFEAVVRTARAIRALCRSVGLPCYPKTSGKSGLHVLVPLGAQVGFTQARMLADLLALIVARRLPDVCTVERALRARDGRVYIDAVQNGRGRLLVAPYSVRPEPGATVSTPLRWREVTPRLDPRRFTIRTLPARLRRQRDEPMRGVLSDRPDLLVVLERLACLREAAGEVD